MTHKYFGEHTRGCKCEDCAEAEPLCPDSPDGKHHSAPIGSEEDLTLEARECWYCGEKARAEDKVGVR